MGLGAIQWARIARIFPGFRVGDATGIGFGDREFFRQMELPADERTIPARELCRAGAMELVREYGRLPGKRYY